MFLDKQSVQPTWRRLAAFALEAQFKSSIKLTFYRQTRFGCFTRGGANFELFTRSFHGLNIYSNDIFFEFLREAAKKKLF